MNKFSSLTLPGVQDFVLSFFFFIEDKKITTLILAKINKIIENFHNFKKKKDFQSLLFACEERFFKTAICNEKICHL